jgi:hypothetical protein
MNLVYDSLVKFQKKNPGSVAWRVKKHCEVIEKHLNPGEEVVFTFAGQKNDAFYDVFRTSVVVLTNKRILIGRKRLLWGYFLSSITPDLYNDLLVYQGLIWGKIVIDTVKEEVTISNLSKKGLADIETNITEMMMREKMKYKTREDEESKK